MSARRVKVRLILFVMAALASGWIGVWVDARLPEAEGNSPGMGLWLILPFVTMLVLRLAGRDWRDIGVKFNFKGNLRWYAGAAVVYPAVMLVVIGLAMLFGAADAADADWSAAAALVGGAVLGSVVKNILEEFAWRGYLTPKLIELKLNDWLVYLVSGLVWGLWHAPYYLVFLPESSFGSISREAFLLTGCVVMVAWSVMYSEIFRLTRSVWPSVLMHVVKECVPELLVASAGVIAFTRAGELWFHPTTGIAATALFLGVGLWLRSIRVKKEYVR